MAVRGFEEINKKIAQGAPVKEDAKQWDHIFINVQFPKSIIDSIDNSIKEAGFSRSAWIRQACIEKLKREKE